MKGVFRGAFNRVLALAARFLPGATSLRPWLHRLRGVKIHGRVFIGDDVYLDNEYPESIEIHDGAQICLRSVLVAHTRGPAKIIIGRHAFVGAGSLITAASGSVLQVGDGSVITAGSVISSSVPAQTVVGLQKAKPLAHASVPLTMNTTYQAFLDGLRPLQRKQRSKTGS
ncbi:hypothetical protein F183_A51810 [Bryobacterales bacterium F-183]|nr:hypothetical protein F183_A51810 [Bryobacterales bacterium F-183]